MQQLSVLPPASRSSALPAQALYGREDAQNTFLRTYYQCVTSNTPSIVFVTGEGGLGKTRFLIEVEARLHRLDGNVTVAYGRALAQYAESNGYQPVREALADLVFEAQRKDRQSLLQRTARALRASAPDWLEAVPAVGSLLKAAAATANTIFEDGQPKNLENSLTAQFCDLIKEIIADGPLVLCLDDLHWADASTVDLIYSLTQSIQSGPLVVVCAFREGDLRRGENVNHPLLETVYRIERYCSVTRIALAHLTLQQLSELVESAIGRPPLPRLVATLMKLTSGNPLFVQEYLGLLIDRLGPKASPASLDAALDMVDTLGPPRRIEAVIEERLARLGDLEIRTLEVAALFGPVFAPDDVLAVVDLGAQDARAALRSLCRRHALINAVPRPDGGARYAFHHATVAQVLEARLKRLDPFDYQELHRAIAGHLANSREMDLALLERLAHHALASGDDEAALEAALEAAKAAWQLGAVTESLRLLRAVTANLNRRWPIEAPIVAAATLRLRAANAVADHEDAVRFGIQLASHPELGPKMGADARLALARALRMTNRWQDARATAQAIASDTSAAASVRAEALLMIGQIELCGTPACVAAALSALRDAEALSPPPDILYQVVGHIGLSRLVVHDHAGALAALEAAIQHADATKQPLDRYEALHWRSKAEIACLRLAEAMRTLDELEYICDRAGVASSVPFHVRDRARVLALEGRFSSSAAVYCRYLETVCQLNSAMQFRRGLATLACQCIELSDLGRPQEISVLAGSFDEPLSDTWLGTDQRAAVTLTLEIGGRHRSFEQLAAALEARGLVTGEDLAAVRAIYCFDVPDLNQLRREISCTDA